MATTRVEQDGVVLQLGSFERSVEVFYDISAEKLIIQTVSSANVKKDVVRASATETVILVADSAILTLAAGSITLPDATNIVLNATTGTKIGTATTQKLGFFNAAPVAQPSAYTQTYATAEKTHANPTASSVATTAVTQTTPFGYAGAAQGDAVATTINQIIVDLADLKQLVNSVIDDLQALGLIG